MEDAARHTPLSTDDNTPDPAPASDFAAHRCCNTDGAELTPRAGTVDEYPGRPQTINSAKRTPPKCTEHPICVREHAQAKNEVFIEKEHQMALSCFKHLVLPKSDDPDLQFRRPPSTKSHQETEPQAAQLGV